MPIDNLLDSVFPQGAEDELVGMRLKEGQGWLEEMYVVSGLINEMTSQLPTQSAVTSSNTDTTVESVIGCLRKAHSIFHGLLVRTTTVKKLQFCPRRRSYLFFLTGTQLQLPLYHPPRGP